MGKIYRPKGRAGQFGEYAVNLYKGCTHGCKYPCYVSKMAARFGWGPFDRPEPSKDVIANIEKDAHKYRGHEVFLCFTTDPYMHLDEKYQLTRQAIKILHDNEVAVRILTKGGKRSERDFDLLAARPLSCYGATLTFLDEGLSKTWEPGAALPESRLGALKKAHDMGIPTWVSLEPVIDVEQTLAIIRRTHKYVDKYGIGRWNYDARAKNIDWRAFGHEAVSLCKKYGKDYYIKSELAKHI